MITVYFETKGYAEKIATFESEDIYIKCVPILEEIAKEDGMIITETNT